MRSESIQPARPDQEPLVKAPEGATFDTKAFSEEDTLAMLSIVGKVENGEYHRIFDAAQGAVRVIDPETQEVVLDTSANDYYALEAELRQRKSGSTVQEG